MKKRLRLSLISIFFLLIFTLAGGVVASAAENNAEVASIGAPDDEVSSTSYVQLASSRAALTQRYENLEYSFDLGTYTLVIYGSGDMADFDNESTKAWHSYDRIIKTVIIEEGVTSISSFAFQNCTALENVEIADSVTSIDSYAFKDCTALKSIVIPDSVTNISIAAFSGCSSIESMTLPFIGSKIFTESDTYRYPLGYIFGTKEYNGGVATTQIYYNASEDAVESGCYYIPEKLKSVTVNVCQMRLL